MSQRRVLVPVNNPVGGIRTYLMYNLKRLHEEGYRFTFLAPQGEGFDKFKKDTASWNETEYIDIPGGKNAGLAAIHKTLRRQHFDLIHSQGIHFGTLSALANYFRQTPHLITLHNVIVPGYNDFGRFPRLKNFLASCVTRRASCIIPVSRDCEANYLHYFPAWKKGPVQIKPIINGVDVDKLECSRIQFERNTQTEPQSLDCAVFPQSKDCGSVNNKVILGGFFGRFMPEKGFDLVLKALELLVQRGYRDRFRIIATTDNTGYLKETLHATAANPDVAQMVHFIEAVPDIAPLLLQIDVLLTPSRHEACPLLPMESFILGVPVIGSDCLGLREVLNGTPGIIVPSENPEALCDALSAFIDDPNPAREAAQDYVADAVQRFDVNIAVEQLLAIYRSLAG